MEYHSVFQWGTEQDESSGEQYIRDAQTRLPDFILSEKYKMYIFGKLVFWYPKR